MYSCTIRRPTDIGTRKYGSRSEGYNRQETEMFKKSTVRWMGCNKTRKYNECTWGNELSRERIQPREMSSVASILGDLRVACDSNKNKKILLYYN